jgi:hypothetical protein
MVEAAEGDIALIVFREILEGDKLKFVAQSNFSETGGGARDLRFRNWEKMKPALTRLFPTSRTVARRRAGATAIDVYVGNLNWIAGEKTVSREAVLEPPTDARPEEGRIARVHEYDCFSVENIPDGSGRLLVLFVQKKDGSVWPFVITEQSLEHEGWDPSVAGFLLSALNTKRRLTNAAYGFYDLESGEQFVR